MNCHVPDFRNPSHKFYLPTHHTLLQLLRAANWAKTSPKIRGEQKKYTIYSPWADADCVINFSPGEKILALDMYAMANYPP
jgi:hypothetical protein